MAGPCVETQTDQLSNGMVGRLGIDSLGFYPQLPVVFLFLREVLVDHRLDGGWAVTTRRLELSSVDVHRWCAA